MLAGFRAQTDDATPAPAPSLTPTPLAEARSPPTATTRVVHVPVATQAPAATQVVAGKRALVDRIHELETNLATVQTELARQTIARQAAEARERVLQARFDELQKRILPLADAN